MISGILHIWAALNMAEELCRVEVVCHKARQSKAVRPSLRMVGGDM